MRHGTVEGSARKPVVDRYPQRSVSPEELVRRAETAMEQRGAEAGRASARQPDLNYPEPQPGVDSEPARLPHRKESGPG